MNCLECHHRITDTTHQLCRSHAYCARGPQYYKGFCTVCDDLWYRARGYEEYPLDAAIAWELLQRWVLGFRKNSKLREKGQHYFFDAKEYAEFSELGAIHGALKESGRGAFYAWSPSKEVSICNLLFKFFP